MGGGGVNPQSLDSPEAVRLAVQAELGLPARPGGLELG